MWAIHHYWLYIKSSAQCSGWHSGTAARVQERRDETGVVAVPRTETKMAVAIERPRGRDRLAACRLPLSGWDSSDWPAIVGIKLGITLSPQEHPTVISLVRLNRSELVQGWNPLTRQLFLIFCANLFCDHEKYTFIPGKYYYLLPPSTYLPESHLHPVPLFYGSFFSDCRKMMRMGGVG